jgi:anti-anti-sigma factor
MEIKTTKENDKYLVKISGMVDSASSPELQDAVDAIATETLEKGGFNVVFDLADVEFISSAGLRALLLARKTADRQNGSIEVRNVKQSIREVFDMTGFSKILNLR